MDSPSEDIFVRDTVTVRRQCLFCRQFTEKKMDKYGYLMWKEGMYVQDAFPYMDANDREWLVSGTHSACFDAAF